MGKKHQEKKQAKTPVKRPEWPPILDRYYDEVSSKDPEHHPRRLTKRYHGLDVPLWYGRVHVSDVEGWVENIRLRHYLGRWRAHIGDHAAYPSTDDIYDIMVEADREEKASSKKPFHVERLAQNIADNGIQEPIIIFSRSDGSGDLWDGNRRFYATKHIMAEPKYKAFREHAQWIPAYVYQHYGDLVSTENVKKRIITELNFKDKDHIPWPNYVKAGEVHDIYERLIKADPNDPTLRREAREQVASEYGLKNWHVATRWIKMYDRAMQFKEYQEEVHERPDTDVELVIQDKFEYFDELSKPGVWGSLESDPDARDEVFDWLWDDKFKAFTDVRQVPKILSDPVALTYAREGHDRAVKKAIDHLIANDPTRVKDKTAANLKIKQFAEWLDQFRREDFRQLDQEALDTLKDILADVVKMLNGLLEDDTDSTPESAQDA